MDFNASFKMPRYLVSAGLLIPALGGHLWLLPKILSRGHCQKGA